MQSRGILIHKLIRSPYKHTHISGLIFSPFTTRKSTMTTDLKPKFLQVYDTLKSDLINDPSFEFDDDSRHWIQKVTSQSL